MSAFFVSKRTIDNAVTAWLKRSPGAYGTPDHLGQLLWKLNAEAVIHHYDLQGKEEALQMHGAVKAYAYDPADPPSDAQMLKSLACLTYQCDEWPISAAPLFKQLDLLEKMLATTVPQFGPDYEAAHWD